MRTQSQALRKLASFSRLFVLPCLAILLSVMLGFKQASAQILLIDDFENFTHSNSLWGFKDTSSQSTLRPIFDRAKAHSGSGVIEMRYDPGSNGASFESALLSRPVRETYFRWYSKWSANWVWGPHETKITKLQTLGDGPMTSHVPKWGNGLIGIKMEKETPEAPFYNQNKGSPVDLQRDRWYCFEVYFNVSKGDVRMWIDGELKVEATDQPWRTTDYQIGQVLIAGYWGQGGDYPDGVPNLQYAWHDDFVVATERIGCLPDTADKTAPTTPTGVRFGTQ